MDERWSLVNLFEKLATTSLYVFVSMNVDAIPLGEFVGMFGEMIECLCVAFMTWFVIGVNIFSFLVATIKVVEAFFINKVRGCRVLFHGVSSVLLDMYL